jgi:hypothetical protein
VTFGSGPEDIDTGELASDILAALASLGADADTDEAWSAGYDEGFAAAKRLNAALRSPSTGDAE